MRLLVIGLGAAGRRHARNALALGHEVALLRRTAGAAEPGMTVFADGDAAASWEADAVVVATPTSEHVAGARWALERGIATLVEKPLAATTAGAREVAAAAERSGAAVAVGYNLRFHPALEAIAAAVASGHVGRLLYVRAEVGQYLPDWHPDEDYRASYAARAELGGGALLTLSHELDYLRWIGGEIVSCTGVRTRVSSLELDVDDLAEVICRHAGGAVGSVHLDFLDRSYHRRCRWVGELGSIEWHWGGAAVVECGGERDVLWEDPTFDVEETYRAQLQEFLEAVATGRLPRVTAADGLRVLELVEAVRLEV